MGATRGSRDARIPTRRRRADLDAHAAGLLRNSAFSGLFLLGRVAIRSHGTLKSALQNQALHHGGHGGRGGRIVFWTGLNLLSSVSPVVARSFCNALSYFDLADLQHRPCVRVVRDAVVVHVERHACFVRVEHARFLTQRPDMAATIALGNRCSKSSTVAHSGVTAIRVIAGNIPRTCSTHARPPSDPM